MSSSIVTRSTVALFHDVSRGWSAPNPQWPLPAWQDTAVSAWIKRWCHWQGCKRLMQYITIQTWTVLWPLLQRIQLQAVLKRHVTAVREHFGSNWRKASGDIGLFCPYNEVYFLSNRRYWSHDVGSKYCMGVQAQVVLFCCLNMEFFAVPLLLHYTLCVHRGGNPWNIAAL